MRSTITLVTALALAGCATQAPATRHTVHVQVAGAGAVAATPGTAVVPVTSGGTTAVVASGQWFQGAPLQTNVLQGSDGNLYVGLWVDAPAAQGVAARAPVDVSLVIDTSGSMAGDKIVNARMAATSFIESLAEGDIVSVYAFSNNVNEVAAPTVVDAASRNALISRVNTLQAAGGTNLYDGLRVGEARAGEAPATHPVRRVVVISDGRANIGPSSAEDLGNIAAQGTEHGTQVTAIGVGLDYDENTLSALAVRSSGRMYHLEEPGQMAVILRNELDLLAQTVAVNAYIEFTPAPGVTVEGTEALRIDRRGNALRVPLGALFSGQHRDVLLRARVATNTPGGTLGTARLVFEDPRAGNAQRAQELPMRYQVTTDTSTVAQGTNTRVQAMVLQYEAAQSQLRAARLLNEGQAQAAVQELERAEQRVQQAQTYHFDDARVQGQLRRQAESVRRGRAAAESVQRAPAAAAPAASRGAALMNNDAAMDAFGF